jgi:hypothetical protein
MRKLVKWSGQVKVWQNEGFYLTILLVTHNIVVGNM